ncbi:MAG: type 1 glutamine amidotransferase [Anaerolineae bacterium]
MLCYIDIEYEGVLNDPERRDAHVAMRMREKLRFEELAGMPCLVLRYGFVGQGWIDRINPDAVLISGAQTDWSLYQPGDFDALIEFIRCWDGPMIGLCGGHQVIAHAFGAPTGPIRPLCPGEPDPRPDQGPGLLKELGPTEIKLVRRAPLFEGLPDRVYMIEDHYWAVKELPPSLELLATNEICPIQAFRHRECPIYGTQFHPERYDSKYPQGRLLLQNFFRLAG